MATSVHSRYWGSTAVVADGRTGVEQRLVPEPPSYPDSLVHVIVGDETLDQLAKTYYGREDLWWRIADANPARFPLDWKAGDTLVIPPIRVATRTARR